MGTVELAVVVEELGRVLAPGPFVPTVTQFAPVVAEAGSPEQQERFLGGIAAGELTGTLALVEESGSIDAGHVTTTATPDGDGFVLEGAKEMVVEASTADEIAVIARTPGTQGDDGVGAFVVSRADVRLDPVDALDATRPLARVALDGVRIGADRVLGEPGPATAEAVRRAVEVAATALAVETVGAAQAIFDITLAYAKEREQFGAPIGSFQAIKHKFADMLVALERARATSYFAALTIAEDDDRRALATSTAKAAAGDCAALLAKEGIQIHGGIGYTWEHDMHLYVRRVKSSSLLFGNAAQHRARVADFIGL
jgi:alkylation response protein AidB-like acyl-CoA dehydrogenase